MDTQLEEVWKNFFWSGFYADGYGYRIDPQRTVEEVDAILRFLTPQPGAHILDWCGGWGRHSVELARRGFRVTLLDFAPNHIRMARRLAKMAGVKLSLICADFRQTPPAIQADCAINMFTAGIGYLTEEDDVLALKSLQAALRPDASFLVDTMSLFWLARSYQARGWVRDQSGRKRFLEEREFDFWTNHNHARVILSEKGKKERLLEHDLRVYSPAELTAVLNRAGFEVERFFGDFDGRQFDFDSRRIIAICCRR